MVTTFGASAFTFMMVIYALERRGSGFILAFALGCALSSGLWLHVRSVAVGAVEAIWCLIALRRFVEDGREEVVNRPLRRPLVEQAIHLGDAVHTTFAQVHNSLLV